jgi:hypothetical protein
LLLRRQRSGGSGLKSAWANSLRDPILRKTLQKKRAGGMAQDVGSEFLSSNSNIVKKKKKLKSSHI